MGPIQSIAVGIRLFAIWFLWYGLTTISVTSFKAREVNGETALLTFAVGAALIALMCLSLWLFATFLAKRILPKQADTPSPPSVFEDWFSVGCSLIGVWSLSKAIPALSSYLIVNYLGLKMYPSAFSVSPDWPLHVAFNVCQLLFGAWLFLGAKGLKKILVWIRQA
jgi:hypothetical protein